MNKGKFEQVGTPTEIYDNPCSKYVASFIGEMNFIERDGKSVAVRPEDVVITKEPADISGSVRTIMFLICSISAAVYIYTNLKDKDWEK